MAEYLEYTGKITGKKYKPGTVFEYHLSVPDVPEEMGLYISHDCQVKCDEDALLKLAEEGKAPYCVCVGIKPGMLPMADGTQRNMRMDDYDLFTDEYPDFLVYELVPELVRTYHLNISHSPDWHEIAGASSGGISAFKIAWFHPEYFHRVYMASPSFFATGRGNELPVLMRKYETKPLRIYEEYSEIEPDEYFGTCYCAGEEAKMALEFAHYDFKCTYFPGEMHCSHYFKDESGEAYRRNEWLWKDYRTLPVTAPGNSMMVERVIPYESGWEKTDHFPNKAEPLLQVFSSDGRMLYRASLEDDAVTAWPVGIPRSEDIPEYTHGLLHTIPRIYPKGAIDMALDEEDRLYVLTAIGIQCIRSYGAIDVILDLPGREKSELLAFGQDDPYMLYLKTESGIWRRKLLVKGASDRPTEPKHANVCD